MIDHNNKLLFIHIPKNAGTSIERTVFSSYDFKNKFDEDFLIGYSSKFKINLQHATIAQLLEFNLITNEILEDYNSFAVVRDPFTRSISSYFWLMKDLKIRDSFDNFLKEKGEFSRSNLSKYNIHVEDHMLNQSEFIFHNGKVRVKEILRFENLSKSFNNYMLSINNSAKLNSHFKKNKKNKLKTLKLFSKENIRQIQKRYEEDFVNFNYSLEFNRLKYFLGAK